jgi:hypothetical protein
LVPSYPSAINVTPEKQNDLRGQYFGTPSAQFPGATRGDGAVEIERQQGTPVPQPPQLSSPAAGQMPSASTMQSGGLDAGTAPRTVTPGSSNPGVPMGAAPAARGGSPAAPPGAPVPGYPQARQGLPARPQVQTVPRPDTQAARTPRRRTP